MNIQNFIIKHSKPIFTKVKKEKNLTSFEIERIKSFFKNNLHGIDDNEIEDNAKYDNYFSLKLHDFGYDINNFISDLRDKYKFKYTTGSMYVYISVDELEKFIDEYKDFANFKVYSLLRIANQTSINWTTRLINKYSDIWGWHFLHRNPKVNWNFEIIDQNISRVNWSFISSYENLKWTVELLIKYKDYLIFSVDKSHYQKIGRNKLGKEYAIISVSDSLQESYNYYSYLSGSISLSKTIEWSKEIIDSVKEYWNWSELCGNNSIFWSEEIIAYFKDYIDFKSLSINPNVPWSEKLILKYYDLWNWEELSGNKGLNWSFDFLKKYVNNWSWKPRHNWYINDENVDSPSISTNEGIQWTLEILNEWNDKIDFWLIARKGKICNDALMHYFEELNRKEKVGWIFHKYSDWRETEDIYRTGWENLALNKNFRISMQNVNFLYEKKISLTYSEGNLAQNDGSYETTEYRILELLKDSVIEGIAIDDLMANENSWSNILINDEFINDSIWLNIIKPIIIDINYY